MPDRNNPQPYTNPRDTNPTYDSNGTPVVSPSDMSRKSANAGDNNEDAFAGTPFGADQYVGGVSMEGMQKSMDPRDFMYGRDPNYAKNTAANERSVAGQAAGNLNDRAREADATGYSMGQQMAAYGQNTAQGGQAMAGQTYQAALNAYNAGMAATARGGPQANYGAANQTFQGAQNSANQLAGIEAREGPTGAQAQLQSGLNQAQASNLALARSGHGFGSSASALSQAVSQNAAAGQQATNASAQLTAQEDAAYRQRQANNLATSAGITSNIGAAQQQQGLSQAQIELQTRAQNDQAQQALIGKGLDAAGQSTNAYTSAGQLGLQGMTSGAGTIQAGETLGLQGAQAAMGAYGQGEQMAGINMSQQQQADFAREGGLLQNRGIDAGVAVNNQNATNSGWGTALSTAATIGGVALMAASDIRAKDGIEALDASTSGQVTPLDNAGRSAAAGNAMTPSSAENAGRSAAAGMNSADADLKAQAKGAAISSMLGSAAQDLKGLGNNPGTGALDQFSAMGRPQQPFYGMQAPGWGQAQQPGQITSDEEQKSDVHRSDALDMVDEAPGYSYFYKDPARHGDGQKYGPMAQDLLKTPAGASTVEKAPDGTLAVNTGRLALAEHAALHSMHRETEAKFAELKSQIDALGRRRAS